MIQVGVSSCLLGEKVRYDSGHKHDNYICDTLGKFFSWSPVCPEFECGMTIPRESMRLEGDPENPRLVTNRSKTDKTEQMKSWLDKKLVELESEKMCGFIFKSNSPSSGMERVKVYSAKGIPSKVGVGIFAKGFMEHFPLLPVEEDGRLNDPLLRENFIERVFIYHRWQEMTSKKFSHSDLIEFHTIHKYLIMSHNQSAVSKLGKIVALATKQNVVEKSAEYFSQLMEVLERKPTIKHHCNTLQHIIGYFKKLLTSDEKAEILEVIDSFYRNLVPIIVPITLINHYVRKYDQSYLKKQIYLNPHPSELKLRNHV